MQRLSDSYWVTGSMIVGLLLLLILSLLYAQLDLENNVLEQRPHTVAQEYDLPPSSVLKATSLNYRALAADLVWIRALIYFGETWGARRHHPKFLRDYATTVADLDPRFYPVYEWFAATYSNSKYPLTGKDLETINAFLERGMRQYPKDWQLPYSAALNYIGHSAKASRERKLREASRAIEYLKRAAMLEGAPDTIPATLAWFYNRRERLRQGKSALGPSSGTISEEESNLYARLYLLSDDPSRRRHLEQLLGASPTARKNVLEQVERYRNSFEKRYVDHYPYLSEPLWTAVYAAEVQ